MAGWCESTAAREGTGSDKGWIAGTLRARTTTVEMALGLGDLGGVGRCRRGSGDHLLPGLPALGWQGHYPRLRRVRTLAILVGRGGEMTMVLEVMCL